MLAIVSYPTVAEMKSSGDPGSVRQAEGIENFQREFNSKKLAGKEQLPEINAATFELTWDSEQRGGKHWTVIRHGNQILFSEPAVWEGFESRFEEVCRILREKYGERVTDLIPSDASGLYLYGDKLSAPTEVAWVREKIFRGSKVSLADFLLSRD